MKGRTTVRRSPASEPLSDAKSPDDLLIRTAIRDHKNALALALLLTCRTPTGGGRPAGAGRGSSGVALLWHGKNPDAVLRYFQAGMMKRRPMLPISLRRVLAAMIKRRA